MPGNSYGFSWRHFCSLPISCSRLLGADLEINEGVVYNLLMFPCVLLVFYPAVFGIQNDEDSRILEILFGIPDYKYKVWGVRLLMIYVAIFVILIVFSWLATLLLYPVNLLEMSAQLMFPILFFGNLAFMFSTITRSGNRNCRFDDYHRHRPVDLQQYASY